ncbi:MAG: lysophospholipase [Clostridia bacterium]|nr:lysophospholipase [Clostridia bacterium]
MTEKNFVVVSEFDGLQLQGSVCLPDGEAKGIVQLVHGMCEHRKRYLPLMRFLAKNGYVAACYDQRGHGDSVEKEEDLGWFRDFHAKAVVEDCALVTRYLKTEYPNLPVTLFGHSMGSMVVRCYLRDHDDLIDKLIVCGSPASNPLAGTAVLLAKTIRLFRGQRHRSKMLSFLATGKGNKQFIKAGKGSWLTHDEEIAKAFRADPKCNFTFTVNGFENLFNLMKYTYKKRGYRVQNPDLPIHFISGSDDAVLGSDIQWFKGIEALRKVGYQNVSGKLYEGMRHEIHNDLCKDEVYADVLQFIQA